MSREEETTCVEFTALEQINESQKINGQRSFATATNDKTGTDKGGNRKWRWFKLRPRHAGSVLDEGKNPLNKYWQYLEIALLSTVVVVVLPLMFLPTIFYHLPLPITADGSQSNTSIEIGNQSNMSGVPTLVSVISGSGSSGEGETDFPPPLPSAGLAGQVNCSTLQCQEGFSCSVVANTSLCLPVCGSWEEYSHGVVVATDVMFIFGAAIGLISSIAVLVITCIRWKRMLTFPSVFVVYMTVTLLVMAVFVLITYTDRTSLYCSSEYLVTFEMGQTQRVGPTAFCTLAGIVFYYCLFQLTVWWFCHVVSLFWGIQFPFHARSFKAANRTKYIHITMVIVGVVLPTLPVIVSFTAGDPSTRGFGLTRFPPILCTGLQADPTFYSLVLPINIALAIGVPLLIIIFWIIHKHHGLFRIKLSKHPFKIGTAERKILIIFCYYVLLGAIGLTSFTISTRNGRLFANAVAEYWRCEITGVNPENSCDGLRYSIRQLSYPGLTSVSFILLGVFPAVNLIFAVDVTEIKQKFNACVAKMQYSSLPQ